MKIIQSPLNYTGGKYRLLPQILPHFPQNIRIFVDLFCGGGNVGCNVSCKHVLFNDVDTNVIGLLNTFQNNDKQIIFDSINSIIKKYKFSCVSEKGYDFYNCECKKGVGYYNKDKFLQLRTYFNNHNQIQDFDYYIILYVLMIFSFNNQIRFNSKGEFNLPVGKRDFNKKLQNKLNAFIDRLNSITCNFQHQDFRNFDFQNLNESDLVYCDPPYLITCATYNEQGMWNESHELALLKKLDELNGANIRFALSNVLRSKGKENSILIDWLANHPNYHKINLNYNYNNSSYQTRGNKTSTEEVLITNYLI